MYFIYLYTSTVKSNNSRKVDLLINCKYLKLYFSWSKDNLLASSASSEQIARIVCTSISLVTDLTIVYIFKEFSTCTLSVFIHHLDELR